MNRRNNENAEPFRVLGAIRDERVPENRFTRREGEKLKPENHVKSAFILQNPYVDFEEKRLRFDAKGLGAKGVHNYKFNLDFYDAINAEVNGQFCG